MKGKLIEEGENKDNKRDWKRKKRLTVCECDGSKCEKGGLAFMGVE